MVIRNVLWVTLPKKFRDGFGPFSQTELEKKIMKICKFLAIGTIWGQEPGPVVDFGTESELGQRTRERHLDQNGFLIPRGLFKSDVDLLDEENVSLDEIARGRGRNDGELGEKGKQRVEEKVIISKKNLKFEKFDRPKPHNYLTFYYIVSLCL